ncbi:PREDICTED: exonuclease 3'-5' domain-containing protein 2-like [Acropora digitifera]|uniref:exonuclease 3'-5' domain-containing protein 2-like n=1 Tax=Acropora digitifera TaxID=70779 RepID=UPI00077A28A3|nr:PREDICTED: exonuclease 3'-5' domain-containing protein 2-like [Acropora digitifera]
MNYIGIDCEWVNKEGQVNAPVALLQIATPLCECFLVRLCKMDGQMPEIVKEILEDKAVLKFGVGIQNDAERLLQMFNIHAQGCVDLRRVEQRTQSENRDQRYVMCADPFIIYYTSVFSAVEIPEIVDVVSERRNYSSFYCDDLFNTSNFLLDHSQVPFSLFFKGSLRHLTKHGPYTRRRGTKDHCLNINVNICAVCGSDESCTKKSVVPHEYRRHFPPVVKDHHSHDILLTCPRCHSMANFFDDQLREQLAIKYKAPLGSMQDPKLRKVKSAAKALSHTGNKIPEARLQELSLVVQEHFGVSSLTPEIISQAAVCNSVSHGFIVVERVSAEGKLSEFEKVWRKHFVDKMRPKFLPPLWSVDGPREEFKGKE